MNNNMRVALTYAEQLVRIFPCREADSGNRRVKAPYNTGGAHSASTHPAQIEKWWIMYPNAAVGLPCRNNYIIGIDADRHGQGDGVATFLKLLEQHSLTPNAFPCIDTPRAGLHFLFRRPGELGDTVGKVATAIDVRDNAYVIAAGSIMADGTRYSLQTGSIEQLAAAIGGASLPELPKWISEMISKPTYTTTMPQERVRPGMMPRRYIKRRLSDLVNKVIRSPLGSRNTNLYWAGCRAGELVGAKMIEWEMAIAMLTEAGRQAGLSVEESRTTARSGIYTGRASVIHGY